MKTPISAMYTMAYTRNKNENFKMKPPAKGPEVSFHASDDDSVNKEFPLYEEENPITGADVEDHIEGPRNQRSLMVVPTT